MRNEKTGLYLPSYVFEAIGRLPWENMAYVISDIKLALDSGDIDEFFKDRKDERAAIAYLAATAIRMEEALE